MLKPLLTRLLNHIISQNTWAQPLLMPYAGKTIRVVLIPVGMNLVVLENGGIAVAGETAISDAVITLPPTAALRVMASDTTASSLISMEGDMDCAVAVAKVMQGLSWDYEEDLSKVVGDIAAHKTGTLIRNAVQESRKRFWNVAEMTTEYWQEERPLIAKKRHVEQFNQEVDTLRDDISRLEKQLDRAEQRTSALIENLATPKNNP